MKPKRDKDKTRDRRDNHTDWDARGFPGVNTGSKFWPVPSNYKRALRRDERAATKRQLDKLRRDAEATPQPVKHKKDAGYYW